MADAAQSTTAFERFSVSLYGHAEVADACLWLQDHCAMDVNFLLFAVFCGCRGRSITAQDWERLEHEVTPWRRRVVAPLRAVRRWLKDECSEAAIDVAGIGRRVLGCEIDCELVQQRMMDASFPTPDGVPDERAAADNLKRYCAAASVVLSAAVVDRLCAILCRGLAGLSVARAHALMT